MDDIKRASRNANAGLGRELLYLLKHTKKWWLAPILIAFLLFAALLALSSTAAAPFIYTLF